MDFNHDTAPPFLANMSVTVPAPTMSTATGRDTTISRSDLTESPTIHPEVQLTFPRTPFWVSVG